jgi:hypothetical protein
LRSIARILAKRSPARVEKEIKFALANLKFLRRENAAIAEAIQFLDFFRQAVNCLRLRDLWRARRIKGVNDS